MLEVPDTEASSAAIGLSASTDTSEGRVPFDALRETAEYIASVQTRAGAIPWERAGKVDPWNHVEAAMGLSVMGFTAEARRALEFLIALQRPDGGWFAEYDAGGNPTARHTDTNFVAYAATGAWHCTLATGDLDFLAYLWPSLKRAIALVAALQEPTGHIPWAVSDGGKAYPDALVTGSASTFLSLHCAIKIANALGVHAPGWKRVRNALGSALASGDGFDRTWPSKRRYAMDWYYPVLCGVIPPPAAKSHLAARWNEFADLRLGCRCVSDRDWRTAAETSELVMAYVRALDTNRAHELFATLSQFREADGSYWTGLAYPEGSRWPDERTTWTAGAVLLAADSLYGLTPAAQLFRAT